VTPVKWQDHGRQPNIRLAIIDTTSDEAARCWGLEFEESLDDLGDVYWAPATLSSGDIVSFSYDRDGPDGIEFWAREDFDLKSMPEELGCEASQVQAIIRW
jgi:hypothetical protein